MRLRLTFFILIVCSASYARKQTTLTDMLIDKATEKVTEAMIRPPVDQEVCFSPEGNCDIKLWKLIQTAQKSLDIAIFDLTHVKIAHEIAVASKRIPVRVLVDRRQSKGQHSRVPFLIKAGVNVRIGTQRGIMHNKFAIVDGKMLETGSFNYSDGASTKNNENQVYLANPAIVEAFRRRFEEIWSAGREPKEVAKKAS